MEDQQSNEVRVIGDTSSGFAILLEIFAGPVATVTSARQHLADRVLGNFGQVGRTLGPCSERPGLGKIFSPAPL